VTHGVADPFATFRSLSQDFRQAYFDWHSSGQYEGVREFERLEDVRDRPPARERDDWYSEELRIIDTYYKPLAGSRVLEIGCGDGNLSWKLARRCKRLNACDLDPRAVDVTRRRLRDLGLENVQLDCRGGSEVRPEDRGAHDIVFFVQVLEHVPGWMQGELFDAVFSLVAPGGCLFISTPNRWAFRDGHDTKRLFIHWPPRWIRVPIARLLKWGIQGQDPAWPYPPVLHDYVSFRWMLKRARRAWPQVRASGMTFYPTVEEWAASRAGRSESSPKRAARRMLKAVGRVLPLNYYFGDKVIFIKA
jgi:2-polyprenyl-3-methyl-5-hydroxy-6-metoxy-1,4-benzoquinol methylase